MMDEEIPDTMNLDLNLGPAPEPASSSAPDDSVHFDDLLEEPRHRLREGFRLRPRQRWRWRQVQIPAETQNISMSFNQLLVTANSVEGSSIQAGEGSITAEERTRTSEEPKLCDMNNTTLVDEEAENKDDLEKVNGSVGSFFDCNICLDLARDPVVTCCGHLFCWPCLYSWLHLHSDAKECPVCKGEVTIKNVTPIYGRGNNGQESEEGSTLKVPQRPQGRRIESLRQTIQRAAFNLPVEEMLRRIGSRFEPNREIVPSLEPDGSPELLDQSQTYLNRILASNRMRREQTPVVPAEEVDLIPSDVHGPEAAIGNRFVRWGQQGFRITMPSVTSSRSSLGSDAYVVRGSRNYEQQGQGVEDRDSFSSIAAVINSESQMDTNMEIDSTVSLSTSTSSRRRRNDASRISDVDSGESRSHRRRRLN